VATGLDWKDLRAEFKNSIILGKANSLNEITKGLASCEGEFHKLSNLIKMKHFVG